MITQLLAYFLGTFIPMFLLSGALFFLLYVLYIFVRCIRKTEKLSEALTKQEKQFFYLSITYILTSILL